MAQVAEYLCKNFQNGWAIAQEINVASRPVWSAGPNMKTGVLL